MFCAGCPAHPSLGLHLCVVFIVSLPLAAAATCRGPGSAMDTGDSGRRQRDENSVRVTNLSEDVTEADLQQLFRPFGPISRVFLAVDKTTGENRGFAFVNYHHRWVWVTLLGQNSRCNNPDSGVCITYLKLPVVCSSCSPCIQTADSEICIPYLQSARPSSDSLVKQLVQRCR